MVAHPEAPRLNPEYDPRPFYVFTPQPTQLQETSVVDPLIKLAWPQLEPLQGVSLVVHDFHKRVDREAYVTLGTQPLVEIRTADIIAALKTKGDGKAVEAWELYQEQLILTSPAYQGSQGMLREVGPTIDFVLECGELTEIIPSLTEETTS